MGSDNWRITQSTIPEIEVAGVLRSLERVLGSRDTGASGMRVRLKTGGSMMVWAKGEDTSEAILGIGLVGDPQEAPFSDERMDMMVSYLLHEHLHTQVSTELPTRWPHPDKLPAVLNIVDDAIIDNILMADPWAKEYITKEWGALATRREQRIKQLSPDNIVEALERVFVWRDATCVVGMSPEYEAAIRAVSRYIAGRGASFDRAYHHFYYIWITNIVPLLDQEAENQRQSQPVPRQGGQPTPGAGSPEQGTAPEKDADQQDGQPGQDQQDTKDAKDQQGAKDKPDATQDKPEAQAPPPVVNPHGRIEAHVVPKDFAERVEAAVQSGTEDITKEIQEALGPSTTSCRKGVGAVIRHNNTEGPLVPVDQVLLHKLEQVFQVKKHLDSRVLHGEQYGKLDRSRLQNLCKNGAKVFQQTTRVPDKFPRIALLVDATGSMLKHAEDVAAAAAALAKLAGKSGVEVWQYYNYGAKTEMRRLDDRAGGVHPIQVRGDTPCGTALMALSKSIPRKTLIVHLSDLGNNVGPHPMEVKDKIPQPMVHLVWDCRVDDQYMDRLGNARRCSLEQFPEVLLQLVKEHMGIR